MVEECVLKSNKYGFILVLDKDAPFEDIIKAICKKFATAKSFLGKRSVMVEIKGREVTAEECAVIVEAIEINSDIKVILINEENELKDVRMLDKIDKFYSENIYENAKIVTRSVKNDVTVSSDSSIVILGDVKPKARVIAKGNIIVLGELQGFAHAGFPDSKNSYIVANKLSATSLQIGEVSGKIKIPKMDKIRFKKSENEPMAVVVFNDELYSEPVYSGILKKKKF